ncbi:MAG: hypothetical protein J0L84_00420 [Verrucomicrobia bacterium]|nr:hypothetical protein [Verrucomicrobiota bacterium]
MITVTFNDHGFGQRLPILLRQLQRPAALLAVLGRDAANQYRTHFRMKNRTPNKLGGKRTNFWRQVADSVQAPRLENGDQAVVISINHPAIAQKVMGGVIKPKRVKFLTIPVSPEAHGRTARTFEHETGLKLVFLKVGDRNAVLATHRGGGMQIEYVLTASVKQAPDPTAVPDPDVVAGKLLVRAEGYVARILAQATGKRGHP